MPTRLQIIDQLIHPGIIAVIRVRDEKQILPACQALVEGGVIALEITLTTRGALGAIRAAREMFENEAVIGAGTVMHPGQCREVIEAGAQFIVSPITRPEIVTAAHASDRPVMLGAYTPTEAQTVHEAGADFIKLFPADQLGPAHVRALRAPLPHLKIVPTGGVNLDTAGDFLKAGCAALGVGSSLLTREILRTENWTELSRLAEEYVKIAREFKE